MERRVGPWVLVDELGRGGMGSVHRARDAAGREVALKLLRLDAGDPVERERFRREAEALVRLRDPGVVVVHDAGQAEAQAWIAMQLVPGETLDRRLARTGPLDPAEAVRIARALAGTLGRLHARGVVHRDLKPANVAIRPDGAPVLLDLGLALFLDRSARLTRSGEIMGTPAWMPPEQAQGAPEEMGPACDVYGLGAVLYALLTGRPPFEGSSALAVLEALLTTRPTPPRRHRAEIEPWLEALVLACLARDPFARPSLGEIERRLEVGASGTEGRRALVLLAAAAFAVPVLLAATWAWIPARRAASAPAAPTSAVPGSATPSPAPEELEAHAEGSPDPDPWGVRDMLRKAEVALDAGNPAGALEECDQALRRNPDHPRVHRLRGVARARLGDLAGAREDYDRAIELFPDDRRARVRRAELRARTGEPGRALEDFQAAIAANPPGGLAAFLGRGELLLERGELAGARADAERALAQEAGSCRALLLRGRVRAAEGDLQGALADLQAAVDGAVEGQDALAAEALVHLGFVGDQPGRPWRDDAHVRATRLDPFAAHMAIARVHRGRGEVPAAAASYDQAILADPKSSIARLERAQTRVELGLKDGTVLEDLDAAIQLDRGCAPAWLERGRFLETRRPEAALDDYQRALALDDGCVLALVGRGSLLRRAGDADSALADARRALARDPESIEALVLEATVLHQGGDHAGARTRLDQALELEPGHPQALAVRGEVRLAQADFHGALADVEAALRRDEGLVRARVTRATAWLRLGRETQANAALEAILKDHPIPLGYARRAEARERRHDLSGALDDLEEAIARCSDVPLQRSFQAELARVRAAAAAR